MLKHFAQKVEDMRRLIDDSRSASFLLAVSGGMDSMCLLDLFSKVLDPSEFAVAHCNFSLRGEESDADQALVEARAAELGVRIFVNRFDTQAYAQENGISIEMAARELRYEWFGQLCREYSFDVLAVAHNANDNAETLMLNLLRGTGINGLHGIEEVSAISAGSHVKVFRPLLRYTRKQIEGWVLAHRVSYRHDSSNFTSDYKRNKIRNEVFPVFEKINPSFVCTLNRGISYFAEAGSIVDDWCRSRLPEVLQNDVSGENGLHISLNRLLATPHWRYLLYYILEPYGFNSQTLASIEDLLGSDRTVSGKCFESPTHRLLTTQTALVVLPSESRDEVAMPDEIMVVRGQGTYNFNGSRFKVEVIARTEDMPLKQPQGTQIMDADLMRFPFVCRRWRQGDWLIPLGMKGRKKVSDLFADLKFNVLDKDKAVILVDTCTEGLADQQHVAGLLGIRVDDRYKVSDRTKNVLRLIIL
jgi:tRNA(Ile)-lysidine synthase